MTSTNKQDSLDEILAKFFIMRVATPDDWEELKLRNEHGSPETELKQTLNAYILQEIMSLMPKKLPEGVDKTCLKLTVDQITTKAQERFGDGND